jgi:hypothetical protein
MRYKFEVKTIKEMVSIKELEKTYHDATSTKSKTENILNGLQVELVTIAK